MAALRQRAHASNRLEHGSINTKELVKVDRARLVLVSVAEMHARNRTHKGGLHLGHQWTCVIVAVRRVRREECVAVRCIDCRNGLSIRTDDLDHLLLTQGSTSVLVGCLEGGAASIILIATQAEALSVA